MIFLVDYDRRAGEIKTLQRFTSENRPAAIQARLELELAYHRDGVIREVVLLEADSEEAIRRTHRRYFENLDELIKPRESKISRNSA
jgi:hypothetical protein